MYASSGRVVFRRDGSLMAQPFSVDRLELSGEPSLIADLRLPPLVRLPFSSFSVSKTGALTYRVQGLGSANAPSTQLAWFDRRGKQLALVGPSGDYRRPSLSPDGHYVAFERGTPPEIWTMDLQKGVTSRLVSRPTGNSFPTWSPDSRSIAFTDNVGIFERAVGVVGEDQQLLKIATPIGPTDWSRDGRYILFNPLAPPYDLWALPVFGDRKPLRLTQTPWSENGARLSPDGHWIAYQSTESPPGPQVYIQSFPEPGRKEQVSTNGASIIRWSWDGKELYYVSPDLVLTAVSVTSTGTSLKVGAVTPLFKAPIDRRTLGNGRSYDVAADGRFLINVSSSDSAGARLPSPPITVVINWQEELKQRVPPE
jgi:dipeptidyl aminopeptidase/acylaminoacyl peptidase